MIWSIPITLILILLFLTISKIGHIKLRNNSKKINAEVIEYRKEKGPMRNDYTLLNSSSATEVPRRYHSPKNKGCPGAYCCAGSDGGH